MGPECPVRVGWFVLVVVVVVVVVVVGGRGTCGLTVQPSGMPPRCLPQWSARRSGALPAQRVGEDRQRDHPADDDLLPEGGDVEQVQPVADDGEHERTDEGAERAAGTACEAGAADDDGSDRVELVARGGLRLPGGKSPSEDEAGDRGVEAGQGVDDEPAGCPR